jgi:hypothetical protein
MRKLLIALALLMAAPLLAADDAVVTQKKWGIKYVTGGMTEAEKTALQEVAARFPVHLFFYVEGSDQPIKGVKVTARDVRGDVILEAESEGPMFMFDTTGGRYTIEAEYKGEKLTETKDLVGRRYLILQYAFHAAGS